MKHGCQQTFLSKTSSTLKKGFLDIWDPNWSMRRNQAMTTYAPSNNVTSTKQQLLLEYSSDDQIKLYLWYFPIFICKISPRSLTDFSVHSRSFCLFSPKPSWDECFVICLYLDTLEKYTYLLQWTGEVKWDNLVPVTRRVCLRSIDTQQSLGITQSLLMVCDVLINIKNRYFN